MAAHALNESSKALGKPDGVRQEPVAAAFYPRRTIEYEQFDACAVDRFGTTERRTCSCIACTAASKPPGV